MIYEYVPVQVQALYHSSGLKGLIDQLLGGRTKPVNGAQVAVRQPTPAGKLLRYLDGPEPSPCECTRACVSAAALLPLSHAVRCRERSHGRRSNSRRPARA